MGRGVRLPHDHIYVYPEVIGKRRAQLIPGGFEESWANNGLFLYTTELDTICNAATANYKVL